MPRTRRWLPWAGIALAPFVAFMLLREGVVGDPSFAVPTFHFFIVSLTSLVACFMAGLLVIAAGQLRDARVVFLSLAFLGIAGIFAVHGLTTPNALFEGSNPWVGFSARLSLLVGSVFFALSTLDRSRMLQRIVVRRQAIITTGFLVGLAVYAAIAFSDSASGGIAGTAAGLDRRRQRHGERLRVRRKRRCPTASRGDKPAGGCSSGTVRVSAI